MKVGRKKQLQNPESYSVRMEKGEWRCIDKIAKKEKTNRAKWSRAALRAAMAGVGVCLALMGCDSMTNTVAPAPGKALILQMETPLSVGTPDLVSGVEYDSAVTVQAFAPDSQGLFFSGVKVFDVLAESYPVRLAFVGDTLQCQTIAVWDKHDGIATIPYAAVRCPGIADSTVANLQDAVWNPTGVSIRRLP